MFDSRKKLATRLANAADLTIDFATLGEYGLEPATAPAPSCHARRRSATLRSTGAWSSAIARFAAQP